MTKFSHQFGTKDLKSIRSDEIQSFLINLSENTKQSTKRHRYSTLKTFFNFIKSNIDPDFENPCETPILQKIFKATKNKPWTILEKEIVDEVIFKTDKLRNRIMLELMARGGMRIGEVLNIRAGDVEDRKITVNDPKSGKDVEFVYIL